MTFAEYRRTLKLKTIDVCYLDYDKIYCQYNPDYEDIWIDVCGGYKIVDGLYYKQLTKWITHAKYYKLFRGYGRSDKWIERNFAKFFDLYMDIGNNGYDQKKDFPIVLNKPIIKNKYNDSYEIWEGHRRLSILKCLGIKQKVQLCEIV